MDDRRSMERRRRERFERDGEKRFQVVELYDGTLELREVFVMRGPKVTQVLGAEHSSIATRYEHEAAEKIFAKTAAGAWHKFADRRVNEAVQLRIELRRLERLTKEARANALEAERGES